MYNQQYRGNNNPLQPPNPPPMMPGMGMMGHGFDNMHQNYNMNHAMMMPGMNDAPLEFKSMQPPPPLHPPPMLPNPPMPKDVPPMMDEYEIKLRDEMEAGNVLNNQHNNSSGDMRGSQNRRRSRDRDGRRRDRAGEGGRGDRQDRSRSDYKGRKSDSQNERGGKSGGKKDQNNGSDNGSLIPEMPRAVMNSVGAPSASINPIGPMMPGMNANDGMSPSNSGVNSAPQGMMYGGMGMPGMFPANMMGMMGGMMMDPSMMSMGQYGMADPTQMANMPLADGNDMSMMPMGGFPVTKDIIQLKSCSLVPPYPSSVLPTTREKPPGCRTVFIGSLPENVTEEIITEVFGRCGEINSLRLSKKNFCHIRYVYEHSVDAAVFLSGYRLRIDNKTDGPNCSRLHVDYAQARDDQHEFECKQRTMEREARHRERMAAKRRPPSPPPIHHYTDHDATEICDKIKQDDKFNQAVQVVISWLERGDCTKRNVNMFYSMIQSTNSHVRRLLNDKTLYEEELQRAKDEAKIKMQTLLIQFGEVEKVFAAASHKKVWDHFSKAQRKNIEIWKKQSSEIRTQQLEDFLQETGGGEEMDCSDEDETPRKRSKMEDEKLQEENDSLKCQLEAYKNEIDIMRSENVNEMDSKTQNIHQLKSRIGVLENQLAQAKKHQVAESVKLRIMEAKARTAKAEKKDGELKDDKSDKDTIINLTLDTAEKAEVKTFEVTQNLSDKEAKLIGITSTFLHVHPMGASTDYLWSYVQKMEPDIRQNQLEDLLCRFPTVFIQNMSGVGANIERKWVFNGFTGFAGTEN